MNFPPKEKQVVFGYFYWVKGLRCPVSERIPIDSGTPAPKTYLMKQPLSEGEMQLSIYILEARYPIKGNEEVK